MDNFYTFFAGLWIKPEIHGKHGVLSPETVDNHVENVDFPVEEPVHIHSAYTFFRHSCFSGAENRNKSPGQAAERLKKVQSSLVIT